MIELAKKLHLDPSLITALTRMSDTQQHKIDAVCRQCLTDFHVLSLHGDMMRLAVCLQYAVKFTLPAYREQHIPEAVFYHTMDELRIWCENNGNRGLKNYRWIKNHLRCELFKIGRLQYQLYTCQEKAYRYELLPFDAGEQVVYVHVPQGEKLLYADCVDSLKSAKAFFEQTLPYYEYHWFFSESWLLFEDNWQFMAQDANILQFQLLFDIRYSEPDDRQAIERIFGKRHWLKSRYPKETSLQKRTATYLKHGGKPGIGIGVIPKNSL